MTKRILIILFLSIGTTLSSSDALQFKNGKALFEGPEDYMKCQGRTYAGEVCLDALKVWIKTNESQSFKAAKQVRLTASPWAAIPYFYTALDKKFADAKCNDSDLALAVKSALDLPEKNEQPERGQAIKIYCELCPKEFKKPNIQTKSVCK